jgi:hypothetical protein
LQQYRYYVSHVIFTGQAMVIRANSTTSWDADVGSVEGVLQCSRN